MAIGLGLNGEINRITEARTATEFFRALLGFFRAVQRPTQQAPGDPLPFDNVAGLNAGTGAHNAPLLDSQGKMPVSTLPALPPSRVTSGQLGDDRMPAAGIRASKLTGLLNAARIALSASKVVGVVAEGRVPTDLQQLIVGVTSIRVSCAGWIYADPATARMRQGYPRYSPGYRQETGGLLRGTLQMEGWSSSEAARLAAVARAANGATLDMDLRPDAAGRPVQGVLLTAFDSATSTTPATFRIGHVDPGYSITARGQRRFCSAVYTLILLARLLRGRTADDFNRAAQDAFDRAGAVSARLYSDLAAGSVVNYGGTFNAIESAITGKATGDSARGLRGVLGRAPGGTVDVIPVQGAILGLSDGLNAVLDGRQIGGRNPEGGDDDGGYLPGTGPEDDGGIP